MLYRFKSQAAADVLMLETNARQLLDAAGKQAGPTGIFTVEQIPGVLSRLAAAIALEAASGHKGKGDAFAVEGHEADAELSHVALHQRASPLIDMLKRSLEEGKDVVWGV